MTQRGKDDVRDRLIEAAMSAIASHGLVKLSLRTLTARIGKSTIAVFQNFENKSALVSAVGRAAMAEDEAFHRAFYDEIDGLDLNQDVVADIVVRYVARRAEPASRCARLWHEYLLDAASWSLFAEWAAMRQAAWQRVFDRDARLARLAPAFFSYLVMEEVYAAALWGRADYELLLRESVRDMVSMAYGASPSAPAATRWIEARQPFPTAPITRFEAGSLQLRLLDCAADEALERGVGSITNRSIAQRAKTSTSTILYHFGTMRNLVSEAIWHAVFRAAPAYIDVHQNLAPQGQPSPEAWADLMAATLQPVGTASGDGPGFYVIYARLVAETCLLAQQDQAFVDLALILRGMEGSGTYHGRDTVWPSQFAMTRLGATRFAIWIKGFALLSWSVANAPGRPQADLIQAAKALVAHSDPPPTLA